MLEKSKQSFDISSITIKAIIELSEKETKKYPKTFFTIIIVGIKILIFSSNMRHKEILVATT